VSDVVYAQDQGLSADDYVAVVGSTYMRERRPLGNRARIDAMLRGANLIVSAREADGTILGLARGMSDGAWVCYIADLVVLDGQQGRGIGTGILDECTRIVGPGVTLALIAYPQAATYYQRIGMEEAQAFVRARKDSA
jgi:GNAT superfamily N-acetyltransferase